MCSGLGMSMAWRFGRGGFRVALVSRSAARHGTYLRDLASLGIDATAHTADVTDRDRLRSVLAEIGWDGSIALAYYGPGPTQQPIPITEMDMATAQSAFEWVWPAVDVVREVLPGMLDDGDGGLLFAGGLSSVERGEIHAMVTADPQRIGSPDGHTLDPDRLADTAWGMYRTRDRAEEVFDAFGG
ncbi:SDR family NAD(P)-dependent oxidoreductase [Nocardia sp. NPDC051463]|uniref:SDR family NAD(P)-dependent oxidoreductase n=1 Tax=Nocardia sp. NPDC051463 TaxID=3154845 RepID=UPI00344F4DCF